MTTTKSERLGLGDLGIAPAVLPDVTGPAPETVEVLRATKRLEYSLGRLVRAAEATGQENEILRAGLRATRFEIRILLVVALGSLLLGLLAVAVAIR